MKKDRNISSSTLPQLSAEAASAVRALKDRIDSLPQEKRPKVCIRSITYNHGQFIRKALEGFVMQQTNFPFVAIVHEDASTDNTAEILREYAERYPDIIFPIFETENQYSKPEKPLTMIMEEAIKATGAKYVAMCEGDDYWTDPLKLQKQVDFLESHPDYVMCSTGFQTLKDGRLEESEKPCDYDYSWNALVGRKVWPFWTLTIMYRADALNIEEFLSCPVRIDEILYYFLLKNGAQGRYLPSVTGVYRKLVGTWDSKSDIEKWLFGYRCRKALYDTNKCEKTAILLIDTLGRHCGRKYLVKRFKGMCNIFRVCNEYFRLVFTIKLFCLFLLRNNNLITTKIQSR